MKMVICRCEGFMYSIPLCTAYFTEQGLMTKISTDSMIKELYLKSCWLFYLNEYETDSYN